MNLYRISSYAASSRYLGVDANSTIAGRTNVVLSSNSTDSQKWLISALENGDEIKTLNNLNYKINVGPSHNCDVYTSNNDTAIIFEPVDGLTDVYYLRSASNPSLYLTAASRSVGANVTWEANANSDLQKWKFTVISSYGASGSVYANSSGNLSSSNQTYNATYIYNFLIARGFTPQAACGILGNMQEESTMNPGAWEVRNTLTNGYGLVQWTPATKFINWARDMNVISSANAAAVNNLATNNPKALMNAELFCMLEHMGDPTEFGDFNGNNTGYDMTVAQYKSSTLSPETLALVFHDHFERSSDTAAMLEERKASARMWYNQLA